jgi:N2-acetyl-L-2,4-diaminobutanoate deacetylase
MWSTSAPDAIDLAAPGKRCFHVRLTYRQDGRAEEFLLPLVIVRNGPGPTVLIAGGTHGDEFEGQIAVAHLCRQIEPQYVHGTLLLLPQHNVLACRAGTRTTPQDGSDLNRLFGRPGGEGPAHAIARFVEAQLLPEAQWVIDLHSGGIAHEFVLSSNLQARPNSDEFEAMLDPLLAFDAPYAIAFDEVSATAEMPHTGTLEGHARSLGKKAISAELGGAGRVSLASLGVAEHGLRSLLSHIGAVPWAGATRPEKSRSQLLFLGKPEHYVRSPVTGHFVPAVALGKNVREGDRLGTVADVEDPLMPPQPIIAESDGIAIAIARHGLQRSGAGVVYLADALKGPLRR